VIELSLSAWKRVQTLHALKPVGFTGGWSMQLLLTHPSSDLRELPRRKIHKREIPETVYGATTTVVAVRVLLVMTHRTMEVQLPVILEGHVADLASGQGFRMHVFHVSL